MKYHTQSTLHDPKNGKTGNCFQTAIACIFGLEIDEVPNFVDGVDDEKWFAEFNEWCLSKGYLPIQLDNFDVQEGVWQAGQESQYCHAAYHCICEGCIRSPRGTLHSVVVYGGKVIHDPHPSKANLGDDASRCRSITVFARLNKLGGV